MLQSDWFVLLCSVAMLQLNCPLRMMVAGSSGCGKSILVSKIIQHRDSLLSAKVDKVIYCAKYNTSIPEVIRNDEILTFHPGVPSEEMTRNDSNQHILFVLDDLLDTAFSSGVVSNMYTSGRHRNLSVILLSQNLFPRSSNSRNISLNCNYIVVFRNLRDSSSISHLGKI